VQTGELKNYFKNYQAIQESSPLRYWNAVFSGSFQDLILLMGKTDLSSITTM